MHLAVNTLLWAVDFTPADIPLLSKLKAHGFEGVEIPIFDLAAFDAPAIRGALEDNGLDCIVCTVMPKQASLASAEKAWRDRAIAHLRQAVDLAAKMNSRLIAGPMYSPVGYLPGHRRTRDEWNWAVDGYRSLGEQLASNNVTLAIEPLNRFETYFLNTSADAAALCDAVGDPRVGVSYDTFHSNIEDKHPAAAIRQLGAHVKYVQTSENDRGTPGNGHVDWPGVFSALREIRYDGWLCIESFAPNLGDFSSAVCIWRDIEPSTDAIAFEGIEFLKKMIAHV